MATARDPEAADVQAVREVRAEGGSLCSLRPKNALMTHPTSGRSGISQRVVDNSTC